MPAITCLPGQTILDVLVACQAVTTRNAGRRLIDQNGVHFEGQLVHDSGMLINSPGVLQAGMRKFYRITV